MPRPFPVRWAPWPTTGETYAASVNAVTAVNAGNQPTPAVRLNLWNPSWIASAEQDIPKLLPAGVFITKSQVVAQKDGGVYVVSSLSNGAAMGVLLWSQEKNFPGGYQYWPDGYDGGWAGSTAPSAG